MMQEATIRSQNKRECRESDENNLLRAMTARGFNGYGDLEPGNLFETPDFEWESVRAIDGCGRDAPRAHHLVWPMS